MIKLPDKPFTTEDFSLRGGGIDFLGLRWVNLTIVGTELIPELNNVTTDMGTFFVGAWIAWKFRQLCEGGKDYTEKNYKAFREKVEVAFSLSFRDDLGIQRPFGQARNRIGITQSCDLPAKLSFKIARRKDQNSLYAAAIYGPSIRALGLIRSYHSQARDGGKPLDISLPGDDQETVEILKGVDRSLRESNCYHLLSSLDACEFQRKDVQKLAVAGLDPTRYRGPGFEKLKACFRRKLLPTERRDPGYPRTLTTQLLLATLRQRENLHLQDIRDAWYTGMFDGGKRLRFAEAHLMDHSQRWSCLMARQYQRYAIELFLWCFEEALTQGNRSIEEVVDYWANRSKKGGEILNGSFEAVAKKLAGPLFNPDEIATSRAWNATIHADDERFEHVDEPQGDKAVIHGLQMFAGWYWRMLVRLEDEKRKKLLSLGGADRMSMSWFIQWLRERRTLPVRDLLRDIFSNLIFAQHIRVALARFDGTAQRLRFLIGDAGIESTVSARRDLGKLSLPWMPDRLETLVALLCDCEVLVRKDELLRLGPKAAEVE